MYMEKYDVQNQGQIEYSYTDDKWFVNLSIPSIYNHKGELIFGPNKRDDVKFEIYESTENVNA